jgi:hypothetical protein
VRQPPGAPAGGNAAGTTGGGRAGSGTAANSNFDPSKAPVFVNGQWASIQVRDKKLAVSAPDFVHRAIGGYPKPIAPPPER